MLLPQPIGAWLRALPWRCAGQLSQRAFLACRGQAAVSCNCTAAPEPTQGFPSFLSFLFPSSLPAPCRCLVQTSGFLLSLPPFSNDRDEVKAVRVFFFITNLISLFSTTNCLCVQQYSFPKIPSKQFPRQRQTEVMYFCFYSSL